MNASKNNLPYTINSEPKYKFHNKMCKNCFTYAATPKCHTIICFAICGPYIQPGNAIGKKKIIRIV
jgi:hypothetical protein